MLEVGDAGQVRQVRSRSQLQLQAQLRTSGKYRQTWIRARPGPDRGWGRGLRRRAKDGVLHVDPRVGAVVFLKVEGSSGHWDELSGGEANQDGLGGLRWRLVVTYGGMRTGHVLGQQPRCPSGPWSGRDGGAHEAYGQRHQLENWHRWAMGEVVARACSEWPLGFPWAACHMCDGPWDVVTIQPDSRLKIGG